ncbi:MFS transporter [Enterococcus mediterraneensis]|uniref:MFS transporter n=1 Tax=Enterococcus mediterraneensis TaxID=2364791 RepID=UPI000F0564DB|nr:MFS transporter [Enterococcus mediterraneensis]
MTDSQSFNLNKWRKNFYLFLAGQFLSGITSMVVQYAIIWYLTRATGSATILSFATLLGMIPMVVLGPFVGPLIDRWNKKVLLIVTDVVVAIFAIVLSIAGTLASEFPLWLVFVSLFVRSVAQTFQMPTIQSILPTMVPEKELTKVNGQLGAVQSANFIIAPALGAFLFSVIPMNFLILTDVLGAILGVGMLALVTIPHVVSEGESIHLLADSKFGLKKLVENKGLWYITIIGAVFTLIFMPAASLYPLMTMDYFNGTVGQAGLIEVVYSVGMLAGGAIIGIFGKWSDRMKPIFAAYTVIGITIGLSGFLPGTNRGFVYFVILNIFAGLATPFFNTLLMAMIQQSFEPKYLGRIMGVLNSLMSITGPVGLIFAGPLADKIGVEKIFILAGVGTLICGVITFLTPAARNYDKELNQKLAEKRAAKSDTSVDNQD